MKAIAQYILIRKFSWVIAIGIPSIVAIICFTHNLINRSHQSLKGHWKLTCFIYESTYNDYIGSSAGFNVFLSKDEDQVTGQGEKCWIDEKEIPVTQQTQIHFTGKIQGRCFVARFMEKGKLRETVGQIELKKINRNRYQGTFTSTAAGSSGRCEMVKIN